MLGAAAAAALCLLILRPYLTDRADVAAYATTAYASEKSWNAASLTDPLTSPPEYGLPGWRLGPASSWDGICPGTGFVLFVGALAALALADVVRARRLPRDDGPTSPAHRASGRLLQLRTWGIDSVLDARHGDEPSWPEGVLLRGQRMGSEGEWRLVDVLRGGDRDRLGREPSPDAGAWERPEAPDAGAAAPAVDGSVETAGEITRPEGLALVAPGDVSAVELDHGLGRFGRVPSSLRVLGLVGDEWLDLTEEPTGALLRARAANQLLTQRTARLVVRLRPGHASKLRLVSPGVPWDLPEVRVRVSASGLTVPR